MIYKDMKLNLLIINRLPVYVRLNRVGRYKQRILLLSGHYAVPDIYRFGHH